MSMKKKHDKVAKAFYYYLAVFGSTGNRQVAKTVPVSDHCNVDLDDTGFPIGVEVIL